ncbi:FMN-binding protein [Lactobacillus delbrueckii subsp. allosunkii]|uniref:FMN-binding protein n=1 Tax=Lactobacillus delbrueckii subsp. allosunkii TaxID=1050107 RepID=A0ABD4SBV4_9LACO|nr:MULTISPECIES: FMN-binding protein [Lactobacillus]EFK31485.1 FMN-binding domain protein [Lactobacillus delbrueckii subsp. bulgaricus PB2003/044-T3-4]MCD5517803.1 FMN-binding protein [Lactobacillus delbrueckii subsp. sunkii]MCD5535513.1 FMN-binding protein [Lactobacillus delbrueckii subsp. sunkii]MCT3476833.1 FMN-binding protein [Lactobacillus delbrueckii subsp. lactis]MCZ0777203.1 FMN-binding protein [Lactobacillus delbrueckii subsp. sunkii]
MSARKVITSVLAVGTTIAIAIDGYLLFLKADQASSTASAASSSTSTAASSSASSASSSSSSASSSTSSGLKDGTYSGKSISTQWGDVQVQIKVSGGKITTVNVLKYPSDNDHSQQINDQALPVYKKEAVEAQSADIQQVSGATVTYEGFTQSLQNAITQAKES